jgi:hypothetical protein
MKPFYKFILVSTFVVIELFGPICIRATEIELIPTSIEEKLHQAISFHSEEGLQRLMRSSAKSDFALLANQFEAQSNRAFCGPTTAAIILNSVFAKSSALPRDTSRIQPADLKNLNPGFDLTVARFTQETVIQKGQKTRAQILGEPILINGKMMRDGGYQLRQFDEMLRANQLKTKLTVVSNQMELNEVREDFIKNLQTAGDYLVVNYRREEVGQSGGAHISPIGAYDRASDSVLILDVNPAAHSWVWIPLPALFKAMKTFDKVENRGYVLIEAQ